MEELAVNSIIFYSVLAFYELIWYYELFIVPLKLDFNTREMKNT